MLGPVDSRKKSSMRQVCPDPLLFLLDGRGQIGLEGRNFGMTQQVGETSRKCLPITGGKTFPYRPPPLVNKGGETRWR